MQLAGARPRAGASALPSRFRLVFFGEAPSASRASWARIIHAAGERPSLSEAVAQFDLEFAEWTATELPRRMLFLLDGTGVAIGTATAWFASTPAAPTAGTAGRVHWVSLAPEVQGRGLAKPLLAAVLERLERLHGDRAMLVTHTQAARAIGMYLQFNFAPAPLDAATGFTPAERGGWTDMRRLFGGGVPALRDAFDTHRMLSLAGHRRRGIRFLRGADRRRLRGCAQCGWVGRVMVVVVLVVVGGWVGLGGPWRVGVVGRR